MVELIDVAVLHGLPCSIHVMNGRGNCYITNIMTVSRPKILMNDGRKWFGATSELCEICEGGLE